MPAWVSNSVLGRLLLCAPAGIALLTYADPAHASEAGASFYLPASDKPGNAILQPVQGFFLDNSPYAGNASGDREFLVGENGVAGLKAKIASHLATVPWAPSTNVLAAAVTAAGNFVAGQTDVTVDAVLTGPGPGSVEVFSPAVPSQSKEPPQSADSGQSMDASQPTSLVQPEFQAPALAGPGEIVVTGRRASPEDPLEELNSASFGVTQSVDKAIVAPVAFAYKDVMPRPIRSGLRNFLKNISEPIVFLNFMLQLKPGKAAETVGRFAINTTLGAAGLIDVAKRKPFNLPYRRNGFANTLGYYGVRPGPYFYLPLVGSTTLRDFIGNRLDLLILPALLGRPFNRPKFVIPAAVLGELDHRIEFDDELSQIRATGDPYVAARTYYLQKRQAEIDALHGRGASSKRVGVPGR